MEDEEEYIQSEIGQIPIDWTISSLGDNLIRRPDYGINAAAVEYDDNLPTYIRITDISTDGYYIEMSKTSLAVKPPRNFYLENGDIVFARTGASVGKTYLYKPSDGKLVFAGFLIRITPNQELLDTYFLFAYTRTRSYLEWIKSNSARTGQPGISGRQLSILPIPIPPIKEQKAIAEALNDMDKLIHSLENMIEKKKAIKQGALHQLLQPKDDWVERTLGEIAYFYSGGTPSTSVLSYYGNEIPWITSSDLNTGKVVRVSGSITKKGFDNSSAKMVSKDTLLFALYGATAGVVAICDIEAAINQAVLAIVPFEDNVKFLFYTLVFLKDYIVKTFTQGGQANLSAEIVKALAIKLPSLNEQNRISMILTEIDTETECLQNKLNKLKNLRQGMMKELLTGKVRLL